MEKRILLVDDDQRLTRMLSEYLRAERFQVICAGDIVQAKAQLRADFDLIVLDLMLPDGDGLDLCRAIRKGNDVAITCGVNAQIPILMLTAKGEWTDRVVGLEIGADDYLSKPFEPRELLARVKALLRRPARLASSAENVLQFGSLRIDVDARAVSLSNQECSLTGHQFDLLLALAKRPGQVLSREQLMNRIGVDTYDAFDRSVDVHIARIRAVIENDPRDPRRIQTVRGIGYMFTSKQQ
jgi:two-component system, OmpR family, phosphate regulon response regulator OmpR